MTAVAASGIFKQLRVAAESTYGVAPSASDATAYIMRRTTCDVQPNIATFKSAEIRPDRQLVTFRHGTQQVRGTLRGEVSPTSYQDIFASLLAGTWANGSVSNLAAATVTYVAANFTGPVPATITRGSGSFITDGIKWGDIVQLANSTVTANNARNFRVLGITATVLTVSRTPTSTADAALINASLEALTAGTDTSTSGLTLTVMGQKLTTPDPGGYATLQDPSFTLEQFFADENVSELYVGCKPTEARLSFTPSGLTTMDATFMGASYTTQSGQYFTAAETAVATQALTGVSGTIRVNDLDLGLVTSCQLNIMGGHTVDPVIGTPFIPFVFPGIMDISGTLSILFYDETFFNVAINETLVDLLLVQTVSPGLANSQVLTFRLPQIKLNSVNKDDGPKAIIGTYSFQALKETAGGTGTGYDNSTMIMQDSTLPASE